MSIVSALTRFSERLRQFAVKRNMLTESMLKDQHTLPLPVRMLFMLLLPVLAFGTLSAPVVAGAAPRSPLVGLVIGLISTAALFVLTRVVVRLTTPLWSGGISTGKSRTLEFTRALAVVLGTLVLYFLTPSAVLLIMANLFPSYVALPHLGSGFIVLCADTILGNLTGVRLFFPFPVSPRTDSGKQEQPGS